MRAKPTLEEMKNDPVLFLQNAGFNIYDWQKEALRNWRQTTMNAATKPLSDIMKQVDAEVEALKLNQTRSLDPTEYTNIYGHATLAALEPTIVVPTEPRTLVEAMTEVDRRLRQLEAQTTAVRSAFDALATISGLKP